MTEHPDLVRLVEDWEIDLRGRGLEDGTVVVYLRSPRQFLAWCAERGTKPALDKPLIQTWINDLFISGKSRATVVSRVDAIKLFAAWLYEIEEIDSNPIYNLRRPRGDSKVIEPLNREQLLALLDQCKGRSFKDVRNNALVRFMAETGARASEVISMTIEDTDIRGGIAIIRRGKGGKGRRVPFGPRTASALNAYLRKRRSHRLADGPAFWLGDQNQTFGYHGLYGALEDLAEAAGIKGMHPHRLRHTFAQNWLAAGGSEGGAMKVAGWSDRRQMDRYSEAFAADRAAEEARRLGLGDL